MSLPAEYSILQSQREDSKYWWFLCPFHDDHDPSMIVNKSGRWAGYFKCWACDEHGSPQRFARLMGTKPSLPQLSKSRTRIKSRSRNACPKPDFVKLSEQYQKQCDFTKYQELQDSVGIDFQAFRKIGVGYARAYHREAQAYCWAYSWPMYDENHNVIGIRFRFPDGKKTSVIGSVTGIFLTNKEYNPDSPLFITEGPTDLATALSLGLQAIGRPNSNARKDLILSFAKKYGFKVLIIIADNDPTGIKGAKQLTEKLAFAGFKVKVIFPPKPYKDLREWVVCGEAKKEHLLKLVDDTEFERPVHMQIKKLRGCFQRIIIDLPDYSGV